MKEIKKSIIEEIKEKKSLNPENGGATFCKKEGHFYGMIKNRKKN